MSFTFVAKNFGILLVMYFTDYWRGSPLIMPRNHLPMKKRAHLLNHTIQKNSEKISLNVKIFLDCAPVRNVITLTEHLSINNKPF